MAVQALREDAPHNPRTVEEARALVKHVEGLFMPWNIDALVDGFTEDCIVRFGTVAGLRRRGLDPARRQGRRLGGRLQRRSRRRVDERRRYAAIVFFLPSEAGEVSAA